MRKALLHIVLLALLASAALAQNAVIRSVVFTRPEKATLLDGTSQYWSKSSPSGFNLNGYQIMVICIIRPANFATGGYPVARLLSSSLSRQFQIQQLTTGTVKFYVSLDGNSTVNRESAATLKVGSWYVVVGTYSPSDLSVWINGAQSNGTLTGSIPASLYNAGTVALTVGDNSNVDAEFFSGQIASVQVVRFTTLPTDIAAIIAGISATWRTSGLPKLYNNGQIVAWYDWLSGGTDKSGLGNHLTPIQSAPVITTKY